MTFNNSLFFIFFSAIVALCASAPVHGSCQGVRAGEADFDYNKHSKLGPVHWGDIKQDYAKCGLGNMQSSFDVDTTNFSTSAGPKISLKYSKLQYEATPNNNFEFRCAQHKCGTITWAGKHYELEQVHFHHSSEHYLDGKSYPMEAHFVHKASDGSLAVLAVFFKHGHANNEVDSLLGAANHMGHRKVDLHNFFRHHPNVCVTMGSLTTPPCTENVTWFMSKQILTVSRKELDKFSCMLGNKKNNRPLQPANNRDVMCYKASHA